MEIKQVVIHQLIKASGTKDVDTNPAKKLLNIKLPLVEKLVLALDNIYGTKGNNAIYGTFSHKNITNQVPKYTDQYLEYLKSLLQKFKFHSPIFASNSHSYFLKK
ncbi:hypothetical protein [uncultured Gammaproteobacteria bacterium]|nr:hypothetical protein [uncultured Gammaproteobacteria bacterium]